jgi:nucleotide-binding universal stress UspA family protein
MSEHVSVTVIPTKIVVPIDFSSSSHQSLDAAVELAAKFGAELHLIHVVPEYAAAMLPENVSAESIVKAAQQAAEERFAVSKKALGDKGVKLATSIEVGADVAGTILDAMERVKADLLVLSTHGLSGWYPHVFGSVAEKLLRLAPCSTLLLRTPKPASSAKVTYAGMMEWW